MIKTRFAPSPTGLLHLGNVRAALFSCLYATKSKGSFLLRIEDTDAARSTKEFVEHLKDDLNWLGITWQEEFHQSERQEIYHQYYQQLEKEGLAFPCFCTEQELALTRKLQLSRKQAPRYAGTCRKLTSDEIQKKLDQGLKPALRFHMPPKTNIEFVDYVKGPQKFNSDDIGDFIIRRADGSASFMFCSVVDDSLMGVTHVMRGEDHLTNTPRQLMILKALNLRAPEYGHLSLIVGADGSPLSKRHGSSSLHDLRERGFLAKAVLNYLSRLGHATDNQKLSTFSELAEDFQLDKLSRSPARFDESQLMFWQKQAVLALDDKELKEWLGNSTQSDLFLNVIRQNALFPKDAEKWSAIFFNHLELSEENKEFLKTVPKNFFAEWLSAIDSSDSLDEILKTLKTKLNLSGKNLFMPIRITLTGETHGPELAQIVALLGQDKIRERINYAKNL